MSITTLTINTVDYISYASRTEANEYLAVDPTRSAAWAALTDVLKDSYLVVATRRLDQLTWAGAKAGGAAQANAWPRTGVTYKDGTPVTSSDVPQEVEDATILLAGSIALDATNSNVGTAGSNLKRVKAGSAEVEFFRATIPGAALQDETAFGLVACFLTRATTLVGQSSGSSSGSNTESSFCDRNYPDLNEGYP